MAHPNRHGFETGWLIDSNEQPYNEVDAMKRGGNAFGETRVALRHPQLTLNAGIPLSTRRDYIDTQNGGDVTQINAKYRVQASSQTDSYAKLTSRQRANYLSGGVLEGGIGMFMDQPEGNAHIDWGFIDYDGQNALRFSLKSDGLYLELISGGVEIESVHQNYWNIDKLDGTGGSGAVLDVAKGYVYQIPFVYYGFGDIIFQIMIETQGQKYIVPVHRMSREGDISIIEPNLPLSVEVYGDGQELNAYVGGRQISSSLEDTAVSRSVSARRLNRAVGTDFRPLISFRHKTGFESIYLTLVSVDVLTDSDVIVELQRNATLDANASFTYQGNFVESERATEWDVSAGDTFTSGETLWEGLLAGGAGNQSAAFTGEVPQRPVSEFDTITLAARTVSQTGTVTSTLKVDEHW